MKIYHKTILILGWTFLNTLIGSDTLRVDLEKAQINWVGRKVTGEHTGTLQLSEAWVVIDDDSLKSGKFVFDMNTITNTDIESPEYKLKLENHLKDEDFFFVDSFPQVILDINKYNPILENDKGELINQLTANLTIRGITYEINFPYSLIQSEGYIQAEGTIEIDRTLYGIQYGSGKFFENLGDKLIYDDFTIQFVVQTTKKPAK